MITINLPLVRIESRSFGVESIFLDGKRSANWPPNFDQQFKAIVLACGFENNAIGYIQDHDLSHSFLAFQMFGMVSPTIYSAACRERRHSLLDNRQYLFEERIVYHWQRFAHADGPILEKEWIEWVVIFRELSKKLRGES